MQPEDEEAFDGFVRARMAELLRFGHVLTQSPEAAADLVQDALERTLAAWPRVRNRDDPEGYVRRTMVNRNVSIWRRRRREHLTDDVPDQVHTDDVRLPDPALRAAIAGLPPRQRTVVVLRYAEDLSERQVADMLGCSVGTVKSQASKALRKIRERLPREEPLVGSSDAQPDEPVDAPTDTPVEAPTDVLPDEAAADPARSVDEEKPEWTR